jgi:uncharacterized membrane protein
MNTLLPFLVIWAILAVILVVLYMYRRRIALKDDETLHVLDADANMVAQQATVAKKLEVVDKWGKILTVLVVVYTLALAGFYIYTVWQESTKVSLG